MIKKFALIGAGGHAREVALQMRDHIHVQCFVVDDELIGENLDALPLSKIDPNWYKVMIAIACPIARQRLAERLVANGFEFFSFAHPTAIIDPWQSSIGPGAFIGANCFVSTHVHIGAHAILNRAVHIGHDCEIGDYFSAMPGAVVSGNVTIGDRVYLGTNSCIREKLTIENDVTLGMGGALVQSADSGTWVGVPALKLL